MMFELFFDYFKLILIDFRSFYLLFIFCQYTRADKSGGARRVGGESAARLGGAALRRSLAARRSEAGC